MVSGEHQWIHIDVVVCVVKNFYVKCKLGFVEKSLVTVITLITVRPLFQLIVIRSSCMICCFMIGDVFKKVCSEPKLQFHSLKSSLASYCPSTLFLTSRIWGSWKLSQLLSHTHWYHWIWYQNYVSSTIRTKVTISLHEVVLGLLLPSTLFLTFRSIRKWYKTIPHAPKH